MHRGRHGRHAGRVPVGRRGRDAEQALHLQTVKECAVPAVMPGSLDTSVFCVLLPLFFVSWFCRSCQAAAARHNRENTYVARTRTLRSGMSRVRAPHPCQRGWACPRLRGECAPHVPHNNCAGCVTCSGALLRLRCQLRPSWSPLTPLHDGHRHRALPYHHHRHHLCRCRCRCAPRGSAKGVASWQPGLHCSIQGRMLCRTILLCCI
mmetsp:Transcript_23561/g.58999  ORF Transcript_23561/g.58999 Transcript_23561/m.58999 type:complete len:207 (-) Transcript_23561:63-683(-)